MLLIEALFIVDLGACTGCQTCAVACLDRADLGDDAWLLRVRTEEAGAFPNVRVRFRIGHCWHCAQPSCVPACAYGALRHGNDGFVRLDRAVCTGCGACVEACPFGAVAVLDDGLAAKCDACEDELAVGRDPVCVRACPMRALALDQQQMFAERPRIIDQSFPTYGHEPRVRFLQRVGQHPSKATQ